MAYKDYYTYWKGLISKMPLIYLHIWSWWFLSFFIYLWGKLNQKCLGQYPQIFIKFFKKTVNFHIARISGMRYTIFFCCSNLNRTRCRSLVMLYYLYTMRRWLSHSGVELPCLVFTTAQRCQSIYKVAFLFSEKCEFTSHVYHFKNYQNNKI